MGHPIELIKYNLIDVATDQWWYFGPYDEPSRVFKISQFFRIINYENYFPLFVLLFTLISASITKKIEHTFVALIGFILFAGGSVASLGGHIGGYFNAFYYWGSTITILGIFRLIQLILSKKTKFNQKGFTFQTLWLVFPVFCFLLIGVCKQFVDYREAHEKTKHDPTRYFVPELGGYLGVEWRDYIDYARKHQGSKVIEEYWGLWSSINRVFPEWPVDAAIHALGDVRGIAKLALEKADIIITTRNITSPLWQPWNLSQNFWLYEDLLFNWAPDFFSPTTIVWRKKGELRKHEDINCRVSENGKIFTLESQDIGFYKVSLNYVMSGSGRYLLMIQNNIAYVANAHGYVSLPPGSRSAIIPVLITNESDNVFQTQIVGNKRVKLKIESCSAKKIPYIDEETRRYLVQR